ncbi:MAG TPA: hypothetical protein VK671_00650 [Mucilaginibacter sp.]|jgi:hypothetical protein|nr:hypothetical protein [Mucilaginibacter sp.]
MKKMLLISFLFCLLVLCGCIYEKLHEGIGYIKNNTKEDLVGANWYKEMADSMLCNDKIYLDSYIQPGLVTGMGTTHYKNFSDQPDSIKEYIYVFNKDTLDKYQRLKMCKGIVKRSLVKRIEIQLNKVKEPMDTIFINSSKPLD